MSPMSPDEYTKLADWLMQIEKRLEIVEASSPLRANTEQPLVGPPDVVTVSPALARPESLAKLRQWAEDTIAISKLGKRIDDKYWCGVRAATEKFIVGLEELDQGPVAKKPPGPKSPKQVPGQRYGV